MAAINLYITTANIDSWGQADTVAPGADNNRTDGWAPNKLAANYYGEFRVNTIVQPTATAQPDSTSTGPGPNPAFDSFRSANPINGVIAAGTWTLRLPTRQSAARTGAGRARFRMWRALFDGSSATLIGTGIYDGSIATMPASLTVTAISTITTASLASITFAANQYLFIELAWQITTVGSNVYNLLVRSEAATPIVTTPNFTPAAVTLTDSAAITGAGVVAATDVTQAYTPNVLTDSAAIVGGDAFAATDVKQAYTPNVLPDSAAIVGGDVVAATDVKQAYSPNTLADSSALLGSGTLAVTDILQSSATVLADSALLVGSGAFAATDIKQAYSPTTLTDSSAVAGSGVLSATDAFQAFNASVLTDSSALTGSGVLASTDVKQAYNPRVLTDSDALMGSGVLAATDVLQQYGTTVLTDSVTLIGTDQLTATDVRLVRDTAGMTGAGALAAADQIQAYGTNILFDSSAIAGSGVLGATDSPVQHYAPTTVTDTDALSGAGVLAATDQLVKYIAQDSAAIVGIGELTAAAGYQAYSPIIYVDSAQMVGNSAYVADDAFQVYVPHTLESNALIIGYGELTISGDTLPVEPIPGRIIFKLKDYALVETILNRSLILARRRAASVTFQKEAFVSKYLVTVVDGPLAYARGESVELPLAFVNEEGAPLDMTGAVLTWKLMYNAMMVLSGDVASVAGGPRVVIPGADTVALGPHDYGLQIWDVRSGATPPSGALGEVMLRIK